MIGEFKVKKVIITILKKINLYDFFKSTKDEMIIKSKLSKKYKETIQ